MAIAVATAAGQTGSEDRTQPAITQPTAPQKDQAAESITPKQPDQPQKKNLDADDVAGRAAPAPSS